MGLKTYKRHSAAVTSSRRWKALRLQALRRDRWRCVQCGEPGREVDHIEPVRERPDLAWELSNLQTLDGRCHARKTRIECGLGEVDPAREAWKSLVNELSKPSTKGNPNVAIG